MWGLKNIKCEIVLFAVLNFPFNNHAYFYTWWHKNAGIDNQDEPMLGQGINVTDGKLCEMIQAGIIDPVLVTKTALKNAVSVVSTIISADCVISNMRMNESNQ